MTDEIKMTKTQAINDEHRIHIEEYNRLKRKKDLTDYEKSILNNTIRYIKDNLPHHEYGMNE